MVFRLGLLTLAALAFSACGRDGFAPKMNAPVAPVTGAQNPSGLPYTSAATPQDLENLKQSIDPTVKMNLDLAAAIQSVVISRTDLSGTAVSVAPAKLEILIQYKTGKVTYSPVLNANHEAVQVTSKDDNAATVLNARCLDTDCLNIEIKVRNGASDAGLIYRNRKVTIDVLGPFTSGGASVSRLARIGQLTAQAKDATLITTEIAWGAAHFELQAGDIEASGDLVATGGAEENVSVHVKDEPPVEGRLIGNSNKGDLLLRFSDGAAWAFLRIRQVVVAPSKNAPPEPSQPSAPGSPSDQDASPLPDVPDDVPASEKFVPFDLNNPITAAWQKDKSNPVIQEAIRQITNGNRKGDMQAFLNRAKVNLPTLLRGLHSQNVPPELLFLTFVESRYFYSNYDISVSSAKAVGPWQFMLETGRGLGLSVFEPSVVPTRVVNKKQYFRYVAKACDQRSSLTLSTIAAGKYLRSLFDAFKNDPKLAVMAYNMGAGGLNRRLKCASQKVKGASSCTAKPLQALDLAGLDYWTIRDLNAAPRESIDYVPRFMAAQFVGREPSRYGFKIDSSGVKAAPELPSTCR